MQQSFSFDVDPKMKSIFPSKFVDTRADAAIFNKLLLEILEMVGQSSIFKKDYTHTPTPFKDAHYTLID